jgi:hypothetical protein
MSQGSIDLGGRQRGVRPLRAGALCGLAMAVVLSLLGWSSPVSFADPHPQDPTDPATPPTVTADALPTVQINGVVWSQAMSGNTVYAGGEFTNATPAGGGAPAPRSNLLAYDIVSGRLVASFAPAVNRQVTAVAASPDGSRIYVGGDFTAIDGQTRSRIAAFDGATGALVGAFAPRVNGSVDAIAATDTTVYAGGTFGGVGNQDRSSLAAFDAADGALLDWAPVVTQAGGVGEVRALALKPDGTKVVIGGAFTSLNGSNPANQRQPGYGLGMVDAVTGVSQPFAVGSVVRNGTTAGAITSLHADDDYVYGGGYTFGRAGGTLEGVFSAGWDGGAVHWINDCHGDTYSVHAQGSVIYTASHAHYCENIGGLRQGDSNVNDGSYYFRALAFGREDVGDVTWEPDHTRYFDFTGNRHSAQLTWYPSLNAGTYTGQIQGPWSVTGNDRYLAMGGEFTRVNGVGQAGLVRFAVPGIAAEAEGPQLFDTTYPISASSTAPGAVRVHWRANRDPDNDYLTYRVQRRAPGGGESVVHTRSARAHFWNRPTFGYVDTSVGPGQRYEYRVQAADPSGNTVSSPWTPVTVASVDTESSYAAAVLADEPEHLWQLGETQGTTAVDTVGFQSAGTRAGVTGGAVGAIEGGGSASRFDGSTRGFAQTATIDSPPDVLSLEAWFQTSSTTGGKLIGFQDSVANNPRDVDSDRHLYLDTASRVSFGVRPDATREVVTSRARYNDGRWHLATGTLGPDGIRLYVDGVPQGHNPNARVGQHLLRGYWRIGGSSLAGWPGAPASGFFTGRIDEVAVYRHVLSPTEVLAHFRAAGTGAAEAPNTAPVARPVTARTRAGRPVRFTLPATDADQSVPVRLAVQRPRVGTVTQPGADRVVTYTPRRGYAGTTSFSYTATDDLGLTSRATITMVVRKSPAAIGKVAVTPRPLERSQVPVVTVEVRSTGAVAGGRVTVAVDGRPSGSGLVRANGRAGIRLKKLAAGRRSLTLAYLGTASTLKATKKAAVRVGR